MGRERTRAGKFVCLYIAGLIGLVLSGCATLEKWGKHKRKGGGLSISSSRQRTSGSRDFDGAFTENLKILSLALHRPPEDEALFNMGLILAHPENSKKDYGKSLFFFKNWWRISQKRLIDRAKSGQVSFRRMRS